LKLILLNKARQLFNPTFKHCGYVRPQSKRAINTVKFLGVQLAILHAVHDFLFAPGAAKEIKYGSDKCGSVTKGIR